MTTDLKPFALSDLSALKSAVSSALDGTVMIARFEGRYRRGSQGNGDGLFMAAILAAYFAVLDPVCLVLDLRDFDYEWGNTILKAINFFYEYGRDADEKDKAVVIVATGETRRSLDTLEQTIKSGKRIYCEGIEDAMSSAEEEARSYLA
ncbi:MAG: hypothetical protein JST22_03160 [Bacteroidetes bacterium]|nr:hypothetical protein [Bacteroidota bacterium]